MPKKLDATPLYRRIVADAWHVAWGHKHLWFFGFFATFIGFGGVSEALFNAYDKSAAFFPVDGGAMAISALVPGMTTIRALIQFSPNPIVAVVIFSALTAIMFAILAWIVTISIGGLVGSVHRVARGDGARLPEGMKTGAEKFWRVFGVNAGAKVLIAFAFLLTGAGMALFTTHRSAMAALSYIIVFVIFTALAVAISLLSIYATNFAVIKNERLIPAIRKAWNLLSTHWLISIEMTIVLLAASLVLSVAFLICMLIAFVPFVFLVLLALALHAQAVGYVILIILFAIAVVAIAAAASLVTTFQVAAWTLLWEELTGQRRAARLLHFAANLKKLLSRK